MGVGIGDGSGSSRDIFNIYADNVTTLNFSLDASIGVQYKANFGLIGLSFFVNNSINDYMQGYYEFKNLLVTENKKGNLSVTSNHYGLSLSFSPKKGWINDIFGKGSE